MALSARDGGGRGAGAASGGEDASIADIVVALRGATAAQADHSVAPLRAASPALGLAAPRYDAAPSASDRRDAALDPGAPHHLPAEEGEVVSDDLRDAEISRLIEQNHRLNEQIFQLLKIVEREKARAARQRAEDDARQMPVPFESSESVGREVRAALEAELRPILGALLRLVQRMAAERAPQRAAVAGEAPAGEKPGPAAPAPPPAPARPPAADPFGGDRDRHANWIIDLIQAASDRGGADHELPRPPVPPLSRPTSDRESGFLARLRDGIRRFGAGD